MKKAFLLLSVLGVSLQMVKAQSKIKDGSISGTSSLAGTNSILELESNKRGLLIPRIALSATTSASPLSAHIAGMVIYNTATAGDVTPGYFYNDGAKWVKLLAAASGTGSANTTAGHLVTITNGTGATLTSMTVAVDTTAMKAFISSSASSGALTGQNLTAGTLLQTTGTPTGASLKAAGYQVDTTALKTFISNSTTSGSISGQNLTAGTLLQTTGTPTGATLKTAGYQVDTAALRVFINSTVTGGSVTGQDLTNANGIIVTGGTGTTLNPTNLRLDSTAVAKFIGQSPVRDSIAANIIKSPIKDTVISLSSSVEPWFNQATNKAATTNTQNIYQLANVGIGTTTPDSSARLDISATDKGFLPPRVALVATNNKSPLTATSPTAGILVYNTATTTTYPYSVTPGYYYWNGTEWGRLSSVSSSGTWAVGEEKVFSYFASDASWATAGSTKTIMNGKTVTSTTTTTSKLLSEAMVAGGGSISNALVINGLRLDFLRANPRFVNTTSSPVTYSITSITTVNNYASGTKTTVAANAINFIVDGDNNFLYSNNNAGELCNGYIVFSTGEWYEFSFYLINYDGEAQGYTTARRLR